MAESLESGVLTHVVPLYLDCCTPEKVNNRHCRCQHDEHVSEKLLRVHHEVCAQLSQKVMFNLLTEVSGLQPCIEPGMYGGDIGPRTEKLFAAALEDAKTIFWNGPVGKFEVAEFAHGTSSVAGAMAQATAQGVITIIGGGDSVSAVEGLGFGDSSFSHVSTGNYHRN